MCQYIRPQWVARLEREAERVEMMAPAACQPGQGSECVHRLIPRNPSLRVVAFAYQRHRNPTEQGWEDENDDGLLVYGLYVQRH